MPLVDGPGNRPKDIRTAGRFIAEEVGAGGTILVHCHLDMSIKDVGESGGERRKGLFRSACLEEVDGLAAAFRRFRAVLRVRLLLLDADLERIESHA